MCSVLRNIAARGDTAQDPKAEDGYVRQNYATALAESIESIFRQRGPAAGRWSAWGPIVSTLVPEEAKRQPIEIKGYAIVSDDDRIARHDGLIPASLRNEKDWDCFQRALADSDLVVLGRRSHELAPNVRGDQQLVISRGAIGLEQHANVWWWNPARVNWMEVARELLPRGGGVAVPGGQVVFDLFLKIGFDAFHLTRAHGVRLPGRRALFSGCDAGLSAEAILASGGLRVSQKIVLDAEHGVDISVWRAVRETAAARGENR